MTNKRKRYRLHYPNGVVERDLSSQQLRHMKRAAAHPNARLKSVEEVKSDDDARS